MTLERIFSKDWPPARMASVEIFGVACRELQAVTDDRLTLKHVGQVATMEDAERWVNGDDEIVPDRIFNIEGGNG